jgi:MFS family permease
MSNTQAVEQTFQSNIRRLYLYTGLMSFSLWMPIWIVFLEKDRGLTLAQIYLIAGIGWLVMTVADVPAGALADRLGRKAVVVCGVALFAVGMGVLTSVPGLVAVAIGYLVWATGQALISGTDVALLYESAVLAGRKEEYAKIQSNAFQIGQGAQAVSSVLGGFLALYRLWLPMLITAALAAVALIVLSTVKEPPVKPEDRQGYFAILRSSAKYLRHHPRATSLLTYTALAAGTAFFVPFVLFQPEMAAHAVSVAWFGLLFTGLRTASLLGLRYGHKLINPDNQYKVMAAVPVLVAVMFVGVALSRNWWMAYICMLLLTTLGPALRPSLSALLNRMVPSEIRATLLSTQNVTMTLFIAVMHPAVGGVADGWGLKYAFVLLAAFSLVPLAAVVVLVRAKGSVEADAGTAAQAGNAAAADTAVVAENMMMAEEPVMTESTMMAQETLTADEASA